MLIARAGDLKQEFMAKLAFKKTWVFDKKVAKIEINFSTLVQDI